MERITLKKKSELKEILLSRLEASCYGLVKKTNCAYTPVYLFVNVKVSNIAIYLCGLTNDELIITDYKATGKLKILMDEFKTRDDACLKEICSIIETIADGSFFKKNSAVVFL
jgi:hypothetical protein